MQGETLFGGGLHPQFGPFSPSITCICRLGNDFGPSALLRNRFCCQGCPLHYSETDFPATGITTKGQSTDHPPDLRRLSQQATTLNRMQQQPTAHHDACNAGRKPYQGVCKTVGTAEVEAHASLEGEEEPHRAFGGAVEQVEQQMRA